MKKPSADIKLENLLAFVQPDMDAALTTKANVLCAFTECGLATAEHASILTGIEYKRAAEALNELCSSSFTRPAALRTVPVRLEQRRGRSQKMYVLTEEGAALVRLLYDCPRLQPPKLTEPLELTAAYASMSVHVKAHQANLDSTVEHVIPFGQGKNNIRADVLITLPSDTQVIIEIEQQANNGTLPRVVDKLLRQDAFFKSHQSGEYNHNIRVLFNLPEGDEKTIPLWREALGMVKQQNGGQLAFRLYWQPIVQFLDCPQWNTLDGFILLKPLQLAPDPDLENSPQQTPVEIPTLGLEPATVAGMRAVMLARNHVLGQQLRQMQNSVDHELRVCAFFETVNLIYDASHYRDSPVDLYAAQPLESLALLKRYLHDNQNATLLQQLQQMHKWIFEHQTGIMSMRNGYSAMLWDGFLMHHGFSRGGALAVSVQIPEIGEQNSDIYVEVHIRNPMRNLLYPFFTTLYQKTPQEKSLEWVLQALLLYPAELGLGQKPWAIFKAKNRTK